MRLRLFFSSKGQRGDIILRKKPVSYNDKFDWQMIIGKTEAELNSFIYYVVTWQKIESVQPNLYEIDEEELSLLILRYL